MECLAPAETFVAMECTAIKADGPSQPVDGLLEKGGEQPDVISVHKTVVHIHGHIYPQSPALPYGMFLSCKP